MAIRDLAYLQVLGLPLDVNRPQGPMEVQTQRYRVYEKILGYSSGRLPEGEIEVVGKIAQRSEHTIIDIK